APVCRQSGELVGRVVNIGHADIARRQHRELGLRGRRGSRRTTWFDPGSNRLTEIATWDDRLLAEQLKDLSLLGLDFSLEVAGFDMAEIDLRILSLENPPEDDDPADGVC